MSSSGAAEPFVAGVKLSAEELVNAATGPVHAMPDFSASRFTVLNYFRGESHGHQGYVVGSECRPPARDWAWRRLLTLSLTRVCVRNQAPGDPHAACSSST